MRKEMTKAMNDIHHGHTKYNHLLKQARQEIYLELERKTLTPFTQSELFKQLLERLSFGTDLRDLGQELAEFEV